MNEKLCKHCKSYDDTWDYFCFCPDCQKVLNEDEVEE